MDKVKIKRIKRNNKEITAKEKVLAGLGLGASLMGGIGAGAQQTRQNPIVSTVKKDGKTASGKIKENLKKFFGETLGVKEAKAETGGWYDSSVGFGMGGADAQHWAQSSQEEKNKWLTAMNEHISRGGAIASPGTTVRSLPENYIGWDVYAANKGLQPSGSGDFNNVSGSSVLQQYIADQQNNNGLTITQNNDGSFHITGGAANVDKVVSGAEMQNFANSWSQDKSGGVNPASLIASPYTSQHYADQFNSMYAPSAQTGSGETATEGNSIPSSQGDNSAADTGGETDAGQTTSGSLSYEESPSDSLPGASGNTTVNASFAPVGFTSDNQPSSEESFRAQDGTDLYKIPVDDKGTEILIDAEGNVYEDVDGDLINTNQTLSDYVNEHYPQTSPAASAGSQNNQQATAPQAQSRVDQLSDEGYDLIDKEAGLFYNNNTGQQGYFDGDGKFALFVRSGGEAPGLNTQTIPPKTEVQQDANYANAEPSITSEVSLSPEEQQNLTAGAINNLLKINPSQTTPLPAPSLPPSLYDTNAVYQQAPKQSQTTQMSQAAPAVTAVGVDNYFNAEPTNPPSVDVIPSALDTNPTLDYIKSTQENLIAPSTVSKYDEAKPFDKSTLTNNSTVPAAKSQETIYNLELPNLTAQEANLSSIPKVAQPVINPVIPYSQPQQVQTLQTIPITEEVSLSPEEQQNLTAGAINNVLKINPSQSAALSAPSLPTSPYSIPDIANGTNIAPTLTETDLKNAQQNLEQINASIIPSVTSPTTVINSANKIQVTNIIQDSSGWFRRAEIDGKAINLDSDGNAWDDQGNPVQLAGSIFANIANTSKESGGGLFGTIKSGIETVTGKAKDTISNTKSTITNVISKDVQKAVANNTKALENLGLRVETAEDGKIVVRDKDGIYLYENTPEDFANKTISLDKSGLSFGNLGKTALTAGTTAVVPVAGGLLIAAGSKNSVKVDFNQPVMLYNKNTGYSATMDNGSIFFINDTGQIDRIFSKQDFAGQITQYNQDIQANRAPSRETVNYLNWLNPDSKGGILGSLQNVVSRVAPIIPSASNPGTGIITNWANMPNTPAP